MMTVRWGISFLCVYGAMCIVHSDNSNLHIGNAIFRYKIWWKYVNERQWECKY